MIALGTTIESPVRSYHHKSVCSILKKPSLHNSEDSFKYKRHIRTTSNPFNAHN